jgi:hypothetical protein
VALEVVRVTAQLRADHRQAIVEGGERLGAMRARDDVLTLGQRGADHQLAVIAGLHACNELRTLFDRLNGALGIGLEGLANRRQVHPPAGAVKQLYAQLGLESLNPRGQGRLAHEYARGGPPNGALSRYLHERLDLSKLHAGSGSSNSVGQ